MSELIEGKSTCHPVRCADVNGEGASGCAATEAPPAVPSDEDLVASASKGDKEAFGELIQLQWNACQKRAMVMIRNRSDAEDEVQNAFWKAFQRLDQFRG